MLTAVTDLTSFAENLNIFYTRFDTGDCSDTCKVLLETLPILEPVHPIPFTVEDMHQLQRMCKPGKAPGLDGIHARVLKDCATELFPSCIHFSWITQNCFSACFMESTHHHHTRKSHPSKLNLYQPVIMNFLEKPILKTLLSNHDWILISLPTRPEWVQRMLWHASFTYNTW